MPAWAANPGNPFRRWSGCGRFEIGIRSVEECGTRLVCEALSIEAVEQPPLFDFARAGVFERTFSSASEWLCWPAVCSWSVLT